jgi:putative DNA primase/helicase
VFHEKTTSAARGKWRGILMTLGVPSGSLRNRHGPCPLCGGTDRFRFDDKEGSGSWICNVCGAGSGMDLAMKYTGQSFRDLAPQIDNMLGNLKPETPRQEMTGERRKEILRRAWLETKPVDRGDLVDTYLATRGLDELVYPASLRFHPAMRDGDGGIHPCMVALVGVFGEKPATMHRTFLRKDGKGKAEIPSPRKLMPGEVPEGACVQLSDYAGGCLGIAEGIETAMAASALFDVPVWAAISAGMLRKWMPPEGCTEVAIFGDNDPKYGGQAAAFDLAHKLAARHNMTVTVHIPQIAGTDWADEYQSRKGKANV